MNEIEKACIAKGMRMTGQRRTIAHVIAEAADHPDVEAARQKILTACKTHKIACNITANTADEIVVYCKTGVRSGRITNFLRDLGFRKVKNLVGGIDEWAEKVEPEMPRY